MRSNFTLEVVLWPFLRICTKSGQNGSKPGQNSGYVRNRARRTEVCTTIMQGQPWPVLRMRNSKLGKKYHHYVLSRICYWHCREETLHYKSDEMVNFCGFRCAATSPITAFINFVFLHLYIIYAVPITCIQIDQFRQNRSLSYV